MSTLQSLQAKIQTALAEVDAAIAQASAPPLISGFAASPASLPAGGGAVVLSGVVTDADSITLNGVVISGLPLNITVNSTTAFLLVATNANGSVQASASVDVATAPPPSGDPAWLVGKPAMTLIGIPGTQMSGFDITACQAAGLCDANGLTTPATGSTQGWVRKGIFADSGGTFDVANCEVIAFGGGGANASPANDVRGLPLLDGAPRWRTRIPPSNVSQVYPKGSTPSHARNRDGTPAPRHSYFQPHIVGPDIVILGCMSPWDTDGTPDFPYACAIGALGSPWDGARQIPDVPALYARGFDGACSCQDPRDGTIYHFGNSRIGKRTADGTWSTFATLGWTGVDRAVAAVDTKRDLLLRVGLYSGNNQRPIAFSLTNGAATIGTLVGPDVATFDIFTWSAGFVYDELLDAYIAFRDDGFLYRIDYVDGVQWSVSKMPVVGMIPTGANPGGMGNGGVWGRFAYVKRLRGVVLVRSDVETAWFVRTVA